MSAVVVSAVGSVLAHGGGAPEAAMIGLPLLLFGAFLLLERRARRREAASSDGVESGTDEAGPDQAGQDPQTADEP